VDGEAGEGVSLYATVGTERLRATPDGPRRGECLDCSVTMLAKTGNVVVWHWAHQVKPLDCQAAYEGEWHREWKSLAREGTQEIAHPLGKRRADVLAPGGFAVEFQASPLTVEEVRAREADWDRKLVWIFDAREAYTTGRLSVNGYGKSRKLFWRRAPERIKGVTCPTYYDVGDSHLIRFIDGYFQGSSVVGRGLVVTKKSVVADVLHGIKLPPVPVLDTPSEVLDTSPKPRGLNNVPAPLGWLYIRCVNTSRAGRWVQFWFDGNPELTAELALQSGYHRADDIVSGSWMVRVGDWFIGNHRCIEGLFAGRVQWAADYDLGDKT
jgi:hypothetical protein